MGAARLPTTILPLLAVRCQRSLSRSFVLLIVSCLDICRPFISGIPHERSDIGTCFVLCLLPLTLFLGCLLIDLLMCGSPAVL